MASVIRLSLGLDPLPDFWQLSFDVYPNSNSRKTDVMLLQGLLVQFAFSSVLPEDRRNEARNIAVSMGGKRFDDGIYGKRTRALMKMFEDHKDSPVKDGIIRPMPLVFLTIPGLKTKLGWLNEIWDFTMGGGALGSPTKEQSAERLHPELRRELYGV